MKQFTFVDLFAGIGGIRIAFERAGGKCVFSSEIDKFACQTYQANFGEIPSGDITKIDAKDIPSFDVLCAGFPCQPFSKAGFKKGLSDSRGLLYEEIVRISHFHKPKIIFLENVSPDILRLAASVLWDYFYMIVNFNSIDFGLPQKRKRWFLIAIRIDSYKDEFKNILLEKPSLKPSILGNILESNVNKKYTISDKLWAGHQRRKEKHKAKGNGFGYKLFNYNSPHTSTLSARYGKDGSEILLEQRDANPRKLTPRECARLQGFPDSFIIPVSDIQAYKQFGNSAAIPVVEFIAKEISKYL